MAAAIFAIVLSTAIVAGAPAAPAERTILHADESECREAGSFVERRPYVTGMVASSVHGRAIPTSGDAVIGRSGPAGHAAVGIAISRPGGAARLELEGRALAPGRPIARSHDKAEAIDDIARSTAGERDVSGWATTINVWRDVSLPADFGVYAGGGLGIAAVMEPSSTRGTTSSGLAWQAGAGITYAATERLTIDVGCRIAGAEFPAAGRAGGLQPTGEALVAIRLFDPFGSRHR